MLYAMLTVDDARKLCAQVTPPAGPMFHFMPIKMQLVGKGGIGKQCPGATGGKEIKMSRTRK